VEHVPHNKDTSTTHTHCGKFWKKKKMDEKGVKNKRLFEKGNIPKIESDLRR